MKAFTREIAVRSLKIGGAATLAIVLAGELGLRYAPTAGIITILSIQGTKRETLKSAGNRGLAFVCALILAAGCFAALGFTVWAFAVYLLFFALLCLMMGWAEAIAMDSVLISHFLAQGAMDGAMLINEAALFLIGAGIGVLVNLHLHANEESYARLAAAVDAQFKKILHCLAVSLSTEGCAGHCGACMEKLGADLRAARQCALTNLNNVMFRRDTTPLDYIQMRQAQSAVLADILENVGRLRFFPSQAARVSALFEKIEAGFHRDNTVEGLLSELKQVLEEMKAQELPKTRQEFEARAILFHVLMQCESLLNIKRAYILRRGRAA